MTTERKPDGGLAEQIEMLEAFSDMRSDDWSPDSAELLCLLLELRRRREESKSAPEPGWIYCSDKMPECLPDKWSAPVAAVSDLGDVFQLSCMGSYWQRTRAFVDSGATKIVKWMPLDVSTPAVVLSELPPNIEPEQVITGWMRIKSRHEYQIKESADRPPNRSGGSAGPWYAIYKRPSDSAGNPADHLPFAPPEVFMSLFLNTLNLAPHKAHEAWKLHRQSVIDYYNAFQPHPKHPQYTISEMEGLKRDGLAPNEQPCFLCGKVSSHPEGWHYCPGGKTEDDKE